MIDNILELKSRCNIGDEIGRAYHLTAREVACIFKIASHQPITSKELSASLGLSPSRGSRVVSKLLERGFVQAGHDLADRRSYRLSLTSEGEKCFTEIMKQKEACEKRLSDQLNGAELETVKRGLELLLQVI